VAVVVLEVAVFMLQEQMVQIRHLVFMQPLQ
jgi:hypothetical protein